jgi:hypothetical protein
MVSYLLVNSIVLQTSGCLDLLNLLLYSLLDCPKYPFFSFHVSIYFEMDTIIFYSLVLIDFRYPNNIIRGMPSLWLFVGAHMVSPASTRSHNVDLPAVDFLISKDLQEHEILKVKAVDLKHFKVNVIKYRLLHW